MDGNEREAGKAVLAREFERSSKRRQSENEQERRPRNFISSPSSSVIGPVPAPALTHHAPH